MKTINNQTSKKLIAIILVIILILNIIGISTNLISYTLFWIIIIISFIILKILF